MISTKEVFGEEVYYGKKRQSTIICISSMAEVYSITKEDFVMRIKNDPIASKLMQNMCK